jgi:hypothetical protein
MVTPKERKQATLAYYSLQETTKVLTHCSALKLIIAIRACISVFAPRKHGAFRSFQISQAMSAKSVSAPIM